MLEKDAQYIKDTINLLSTAINNHVWTLEERNHYNKSIRMLDKIINEKEDK